MSKLQLVILVGYLTALPPVIWAWRDLGRFPRPVWVGYGDRRAWRTGLLVTYLLGGWPGLFLAVGWLTGRTRAELRGERERWAER